jgi:hypothetical protein
MIQATLLEQLYCAVVSVAQNRTDHRGGSAARAREPRGIFLVPGLVPTREDGCLLLPERQRFPWQGLLLVQYS